MWLIHHKSGVSCQNGIFYESFLDFGNFLSRALGRESLPKIDGCASHSIIPVFDYFLMFPFSVGYMFRCVQRRQFTNYKEWNRYTRTCKYRPTGNQRYNLYCSFAYVCLIGLPTKTHPTPLSQNIGWQLRGVGIISNRHFKCTFNQLGIHLTWEIRRK